MTTSQRLLEQLEREMPATKRILERVPQGKDDWKPHPKSMPLGYLSKLVASMSGWIAAIVDLDYLDLAGGAGATEGTLVETFERAVAEARRALSNTDDDHLMKPWQLRVQGRVVDEKPRHAMIADTISHLAHHRGQLSVYLRLNEVPLPSIYGPTADESW